MPVAAPRSLVEALRTVLTHLEEERMAAKTLSELQ